MLRSTARNSPVARAISARSGKHLICLSWPVIELVVQVDRGADQRQMTECLREVADLLAREPYFLGVQAEMVGVGLHLLEGKHRVIQASGPGQRVHVPERAQRERALLAVQ